MGTQKPNTMPWLPHFTKASGYWSVPAVTNANYQLPEREFQITFEGDLIPVGPGEQPYIGEWSIEAEAATEYMVLPQKKIRCVGTEVTFSAEDEEGNKVVSNWTVSGGPQSFSTNNSTFITFTPEQPGNYTIEGTSTGTGKSDSATLTTIKVATETVATIPADRSRKLIGVGEKVFLSWLPPPPGDDVNWALAGEGTLVPIGWGVAEYTAHHRHSIPQITAWIDDGPACTVTFTVIEPGVVSGTKYAALSFPLGQQGAGMMLKVSIKPTTVSFENIEVREVSGAANSIEGYFENHPDITPEDLYHHAAPWEQGAVLQGNHVWDHAAISGAPEPWEDGSVQWIIPMEWRVPGTAYTGTFSNITQNFRIYDTEGDSSVAKFDEYVRRHPDDP